MRCEWRGSVWEALFGMGSYPSRTCGLHRRRHVHTHVAALGIFVSNLSCAVVSSYTVRLRWNFPECVFICWRLCSSKLFAQFAFCSLLKPLIRWKNCHSDDFCENDRLPWKNQQVIQLKLSIEEQLDWCSKPWTSIATCGVSMEGTGEKWWSTAQRCAYVSHLAEGKTCLCFKVQMYKEVYSIIGSAEALPILCVRCARWERERERERRKWRHFSSAEIGDEFCT